MLGTNQIIDVIWPGVKPSVVQAYQELGHDLTFEYLPMSRAMVLSDKGLLDGELLRVKDYGNTAEMLVRVPTPIATERLVAFAHVDVNLKSTEDIRQLSMVGLVGAHINQEMVARDQPAEYIATKSFTSAFKMIAARRADFVLVTESTGLTLQKSLNLREVVMSKIDFGLQFFHHWVHRDHQYLVEPLDRQFKHLIEQGHFPSTESGFALP